MMKSCCDRSACLLRLPGQVGVYRRRPARVTLLRGATLPVADCRLHWPVTRLGDRHVFQFGALGGMPTEEFRTGSARVADYLRRYGNLRGGWDPPPVDGDAPEAEWGSTPRCGTT